MKKLWNKLFRRTEPVQPPTYAWLEPGPENPFGVRVLDVRPFTQTMISTTSDQDVAARFVELRQSDGSDLIGTSIEDSISIACDLRVPLPEESADGPLFKAQAMEDKWDVYAFDSVMYFARSWTGDLIYRAAYQLDETGAVITRIESAPDHSYKADQAVLFLVMSHVLGKPFPHPIPDDFGGDTQVIAVYSYSLFGRQAICASESDITKIAYPAGDEQATRQAPGEN